MYLPRLDQSIGEAAKREFSAKLPFKVQTNSGRKEAAMPKRKLEKVKQVKEEARLKVGRPPRAQVIPNKKKNLKIEVE